MLTHFAKIIKYDTGNWDGVNTTIFFSGCRFNCPGCFNTDAQDFGYGHIFDDCAEEVLLDCAKDEHVDGICILGGEPFQQNLDMLFRLVVRLKRETCKPIHIWTGYKWEELMKDVKKKMILEYCDTCVDGQFEIDKKDITLKYRGSSNQRVIDTKKSLAKGEIVEVE